VSSAKICVLVLEDKLSRFLGNLPDVRLGKRALPEVSPMRELRSAQSELRLADHSRYIFGPSVWLRSLIQPPAGWGIAYLDWCQQEHGIAAVLSGDEVMQAAYLSGDPYLEFAKQAGAVPADATKRTHNNEREQDFPRCWPGRSIVSVLVMRYGQCYRGLARSRRSRGRSAHRGHARYHPRRGSCGCRRTAGWTLADARPHAQGSRMAMSGTTGLCS
jgi:hypothetical protein